MGIIQTTQMTLKQFTTLLGTIAKRSCRMAVKDFSDSEQSEEVLCVMDGEFAFKGRRVANMWHVAYNSEMIAPQKLHDS